MKTTAYWWEAAPRTETGNVELPNAVDVVVIGAGFTGLCTALSLAKNNASVLVLEAASLGTGASTLNGGMLGPSFHKLGIDGLRSKYGETQANNILKESLGFVDYLENFLLSENIAADFQRNGRFRGALKAKHYHAMEKDLERLKNATDLNAEMVPPSKLHLETGSPCFHGGMIYHQDAGLHPAKYHDGLVQKVFSYGGLIAANTAVTKIEKTALGFNITTPRGTVQATQVAVCTNGYTGPVTKDLQRRILPMRSAMIATERLDASLIKELMPNHRVYSDTRRVVAYYRPSPDGTKILFGSRASGLKDNPIKNAQLLKAYLSAIFPQLSETTVTHVWSGLVGYTFDHAPHIGQFGGGRDDGLFYAMGYCGSGVARSSYFGTKLGLKMLCKANNETSFDELIFETAPLYNGNPWFMPTILGWHRFLDKFGL